MTVAELGDAIRLRMAQVIAGQQETIEMMTVCLLARGHVLLEGPPGVAKTLLARCFAHLLQCQFRRIQFTPDLMPSDVTGTNVFDARSTEFRLKRGPVFTNVLLADEINRTPPRTQSALLEAMEERHVTIDGESHALDGVFYVIATQNPIEYEGTYPLPEAQLDRFLMKLLIGYPDEADEVEVVRRAHLGFDPHQLQDLQPVPADAVTDAWEEIKRVHADDAVLAYAAQIARQSRQTFRVELGGSPRASIALMKCGKALAALRGRDYLTPDDIKSVAAAVLRHRLILAPETLLEGVQVDDVIASILAACPVPR